MKFLNSAETRVKINEYGNKAIPFLFILDFPGTKGLVLTPEEAFSQKIYFEINGKLNHNKRIMLQYPIRFKGFPLSFENYKTIFNKILGYLKRGDTYLTNLTFPTPVTSNYSLEEIFHLSRAPYKLFLNDQFVVFSPETFIKIKDDTISAFPMKGTIDASIPDAENRILSDEKETFEHNTIVDLLRNDLAMVSHDVKVERFRYIDRIKTNSGELLQVSSEISGILENDWRNKMGDILFTLLPAGSVTGAPKEKTVQIIRETEIYERGFYTGVFGYFDGITLDTAVMIRFIENSEDELIYKSGGGITAMSDVREEYEELIKKIYVPVV